MNSKSKYAVLLLSSLLVTYAIIGGVLGRVSAQNNSLQQLSVFGEVLNHVLTDYVDSPSVNSAFTGAIRGLIESVDPYGGYLTPKEVAFYKDFDQEKTMGIGAVLAKRYGYPVVVSVLPGGPADKAGLMTGDIIEAIDDVPTREMNLVQVNAVLASTPEKPAALALLRSQQPDPETVSVNRDVFRVPSVESRVIENDIAYVKIPYLAPGKAKEARTKLDGLLKTGATSIILDLRASSGTSEQEAVQLASIFMDSGSLGSLQGQKIEKRLLVVDPGASLTKVPLVVLINSGTAGNTELAVAAVSASKRGQIVGTRTFGSGSVQKLIPMEEGYALLISVGKYMTPGGKEIQDNGISPDVEVFTIGAEEPAANPDSPNPVQPPRPGQRPTEDRQLKRAIDILHAAAAPRNRAAA